MWSPGGSEPVFDTGEKIIKLLSVNRTGCQEASVLKQIQSLPEYGKRERMQLLVLLCPQA